MKIEVAENLIYSYLKHIEGCRVVQTNWKSSSRWDISDADKALAKELFNKINTNEQFKEIFGTSSFEQLIKQAEIDVLGINLAESEVIGIDIAFHENGLNYPGGVDENINRVLKKILRTVLVMQCYFREVDKFKSIFLTPKVSSNTEEQLSNKLKELKDIINDETITVEFISNQQFFEKYVNPIKSVINFDSDTSELFVRSLKLLSLDKNNQTNNNNPVNAPIDRSQINGEDAPIAGLIGIGQLAQRIMSKLSIENRLTIEQITNLQDGNYCSNSLGVNFPILRNTTNGIFDERRYRRYYARDVYFNEFYLTSQWYERHRGNLKEWLRTTNLLQYFKDYFPE